MNLEKDSVDWLFSSIFQGMAGYIAFVFTGYVLYLQNLQSKVDKDETLVDVLEELKIKNFKKFRFLSILISTTLIYALAMLLMNHAIANDHHRFMFAKFGIAFALWAIVDGIFLVLSLVNPKKIETESQVMLKQSNIIFQKETVPLKTGEDNRAQKPTMISNGKFFPVVVKFEPLMRKIAKKHGISAQDSGKPANMRRLIDILHINQKLSSDQYGRLMEIYKYRNLVVHGHEDKVPIQIYDLAKDTLKELSGVNAAGKK